MRFCDFNSPEGFICALRIALSMKWGSMSLGAPVCSSWIWLSRGSSKRTVFFPLGDIRVPSVRQGNLMIANMVALLLLLDTKNIWWVIEQPARSLMQEHPRWRLLETLRPVFRIHVWMPWPQHLGSLVSLSSDCRNKPMPCTDCRALAAERLPMGTCPECLRACPFCEYVRGQRIISLPRRRATTKVRLWGVHSEGQLDLLQPGLDRGPAAVPLQGHSREDRAPQRGDGEIYDLSIRQAFCLRRARFEVEPNVPQRVRRGHRTPI